VHPPKAKIAAARVMSVLMPSFSFDNELDVQFLSHDQAVVDAYVSDPFVHRRITARWGIEFMNTAERTLKAAHTLKTPVLMQVAGDDRLVNPEAAKEFYKNISASDKTLQYYDAMYHEIYNETEDFRRLVLNDLETWIDNHA
jgi:alpha-beta hydrolase superfamily lysophospholipase